MTNLWPVAWLILRVPFTQLRAAVLLLLFRLGARVAVAPSFDHASSLGREPRDERRLRPLKEDRIGWYAERGHGAVYCSEGSRRGPSRLQTLRCGARAHPDVFLPALARLDQVDDATVRELVDCVPDDRMAPPACKFALALTSYSRNELRSLG